MADALASCSSGDEYESCGLSPSRGLQVVLLAVFNHGEVGSAFRDAALSSLPLLLVLLLLPLLLLRLLAEERSSLISSKLRGAGGTALLVRFIAQTKYRNYILLLTLFFFLN